MSVISSDGCPFVFIAGRGLKLADAFQLAPDVAIRSNPPRHDDDVVAKGCEHLGEYATILAMQREADFYLEVFDDKITAKELARRAWGALWIFHLLALASRSPCDPLYSWAGTDRIQFAVSTPHVVMRNREDDPALITMPQLEWARGNLSRFDGLVADETFRRAMMNFGNSHHLFGYESRIMQIWSGIECLFKVSNEISRTIALYSSLMLESGDDANARYECYKRVKKDYGVRSMVVHGTATKTNTLEDGYRRASDLLARLLARCVELGRVPSTEELDRAALAGCISA